MTETIEIKTSIWKSVGVILGCWAFVFAAAFTWSDGKAMSIIGIVLFGGGSLGLLYQLLDRRPRLVIDDAGVTDRTLRIGRIDWGDIKSVRTVSVYGTKFVALKLRDTKKYLARLSGTSRKVTKLNKSLGFGELNLNLSLVDMKPDDILHILNSKILDASKR